MSTGRPDRLRAQAGVDAIASAISHHIGRGVDRTGTRLEKLRRKRRAEMFGANTYANIAASLSPNHYLLNTPDTIYPTRASEVPIMTPTATSRLTPAQIVDQSAAASALAAAAAAARAPPPLPRPVMESIAIQTDDPTPPPPPLPVPNDEFNDPFELDYEPPGPAPAPQPNLPVTVSTFNNVNVVHPLTDPGFSPQPEPSPSYVRRHMPLLLSPNRPPAPPAARVPHMATAEIAAKTAAAAAAAVKEASGVDTTAAPHATRGSVAAAASADGRPLEVLGVAPHSSWGCAASVWPSVVGGSETRAVPTAAYRIGGVARELATAAAAVAAGAHTSALVAAAAAATGVPGATRIVAPGGFCGNGEWGTLPLASADTYVDTAALAAVCRAAGVSPTNLRAMLLIDSLQAPPALFAAALAVAPSCAALARLARLPDAPPSYAPASAQAFAAATATTLVADVAAAAAAGTMSPVAQATTAAAILASAANVPSTSAYPPPLTLPHLYPSVVDVGVAGQFWRDCASDMPFLRRRLAVQAYRAEFRVRLDSLVACSRAICRAVNEVVDSPSLRRVLEVVMVCVQGVSGATPVVGLQLEAIKSLSASLHSLIVGASAESATPLPFSADLLAKMQSTPSLLEVIYDTMLCGGRADVDAARNWISEIPTLKQLARVLGDDGTAEAVARAAAAKHEAAKGSPSDGPEVAPLLRAHIGDVLGMAAGGTFGSPPRCGMTDANGNVLLVGGQVGDQPEPEVALAYVARQQQFHLRKHDTLCPEWPVPLSSTSVSLSDASVLRSRLDLMKRGLRTMESAIKRLPIAHPADVLREHCEELLQDGPELLAEAEEAIAKAEASLEMVAGYFAADQSADATSDGVYTLHTLAVLARDWILTGGDDPNL